MPQIYIKLEYSFTNNTHLAEKFFSQVLEVALNNLLSSADGLQLWSLREGGKFPEQRTAEGGESLEPPWPHPQEAGQIPGVHQH